MFPIYVEDSKIPALLSKIAPISINAISLGVVVFSRGRINTRTRNHELIHYKQQRELLFVGMWVLYVAFWLYGLGLYGDGRIAYRQNPFELEAYKHEGDIVYAVKRPAFNWLWMMFKRDRWDESGDF